MFIAPPAIFSARVVDTPAIRITAPALFTAGVFAVRISLYTPVIIIAGVRELWLSSYGL